ncbi:hypothetical protein CGGC5_v010960 [Colletotrichum fructicola Nara gc5]|uniref:Uncharacterized protein n=1 Tax=Colletotrichum fructicola (strain Nara gc5) TaxID=1213859 RepID=A0A7J6IUP8_COLFN|nr:hypothetical protein CGGC5_v010960 [Colletotrichum fructicola Nara gc5]
MLITSLIRSTVLPPHPAAGATTLLLLPTLLLRTQQLHPTHIPSTRAGATDKEVVDIIRQFVRIKHFQRNDFDDHSATTPLKALPSSKPKITQLSLSGTATS